MASGALKALLGVLAVAGYQNRDKVAEILKGLRNPQQPGPDGTPQSGAGLGDILGGLTGNRHGRGPRRPEWPFLRSGGRRPCSEPRRTASPVPTEGTG